MSQPPYSNDPPPPPQQPGYGAQPPPYQQQPYQQQPYGQPAASGGNGAAIAALICGIIGLLLSWIPVINVLGFILGIVAVITGIIGMRKAGQPGGTGKGLAIGGLVTGVLALVVTVLVYAGIAAIVNDPELQQQLEDLEDAIPTAPAG